MVVVRLVYVYFHFALAVEGHRQAGIHFAKTQVLKVEVDVDVAGDAA